MCEFNAIRRATYSLLSARTPCAHLDKFVFFSPSSGMCRIPHAQHSTTKKNTPMPLYGRVVCQQRVCGARNVHANNIVRQSVVDDARAHRALVLGVLASRVSVCSVHIRSASPAPHTPKSSQWRNYSRRTRNVCGTSDGICCVLRGHTRAV